MLGTIVLWIAAALAVTSFVAALRWRSERPGAEQAFRWAYFGMVAALFAASVLLMRAILTHDFRYDYVAGYSSRSLPTMYLWSAFWGGQQGTYLLWALFSSLLGLILFRRGAWERASVMAAYVPTVALLIGFMLHPNGNPFRLGSEVPADGRGLNQLLQDPWMAFHPPVVFLGYAAMSIPGVLAWVAALRNEERAWLADGLRLSLLAFFTLGIGIILGGVWAYKVLGWGGFWGWDPVENASLIPWITGTALIHGLLVQQSTGALKRTNLVLAMGAYVLVVYSTFLTRSGVLADFSVHSFEKGTIYGWLVAGLLSVVGFSIFAQFRYRPTEGPSVPVKMAWPFILTTAIVLFAVSAVLVLVGTSWPLLSSIVGKPSTPTAPFYNEVNLPVYILLLAALGLGPFLTWTSGPASLWLRRLILPGILALLGTTLAALLGGRGAAALVLFFVALLGLFANVARMVEVARHRWLHIGASVAHVGFCLMFVGIVASESWDKKETCELPLGQPVQVLGRTLTYQGHVEGSEPRDRWKVQVSTPSGGSQDALVTFYNMDTGQLFKKPSILRGVAGDFYLAPNSIEAPQPGNMIELIKNQPSSWGGAELTFLRFETGHGGGGATGGMGAMGGMGGDSGGMTVTAVVQVVREGKEEDVSLPLQAANGQMEGVPVPVPSLGGATLILRGMSVEQGLIQVETSGGEAGGAGSKGEGGSGQGAETMVAEASFKPFIGLLWAGTALLALGSILAFVRRTLERKQRGAAAGQPAA